MIRKHFQFLFSALLLRVPIIASAQEVARRNWTPEEAKYVNALYSRFKETVGKHDFRQGIPLGEELCRADADPGDRYDLACLYVRAGQPDKAVQKLREAIGCASNDPSLVLSDTLRDDTDLDPLRSRSDFQSLLPAADAARWRPTPLHFETGPAAKHTPFRRSKPENAYLSDLRTRYNLDALIAGSRGDMERVEILCTWVHTHWNHVGDVQHQPKDPIGLLDAAKTGDNFRCVEYGITVAGCLSAVGLPARVVSARAQDVETRRFGAGHVFAEAYLRDQKHWVFVDPQTNVVGEAGGKPLSTVEFRQAFSGPHPKVHYEPVLGSCFYYFTYDIDERYPVTEQEVGQILLAPAGAPAPRVFQRLQPMSPTLTTHNPADVYGSPLAAE